jgi:hypothetical protein
MFAGIILSGKPIEGSGVVFTTLMVLVVIFSAAPSDTEVKRDKATIKVSLRFMGCISK